MNWQEGIKKNQRTDSSIMLPCTRLFYYCIYVGRMAGKGKQYNTGILKLPYLRYDD
jgi:hypothetical protein